MRVGVGVLSLMIISIPEFAIARDYPSPDGKLIASVTAENGRPNGESRIEVRTRAGRTLARKSYVSRDGEHGEIVEHAEWTSDSQFFVYSMHSSGGHQPWHSPTDFFSRSDASIVPLERYVALIADTEFHLFAPSVIELFGRRTKENEHEAWFRVDLRKLR